MKRIRIFALALFALVVAAGVVFIVRTTYAQKAKLLQEDNHTSPIQIKITYKNGKTWTGMLVGDAWTGGTGGTNGTFTGAKGDGGSNIKIYYDTIKTIKSISTEGYTIVSKSGTERDVEYQDFHNAWWIVNPDDAREIVPMTMCKTIEFLKPARKDKKDNAMFDQWKYSPYTGEKLPEE